MDSAKKLKNKDTPISVLCLDATYGCKAYMLKWKCENLVIWMHEKVHFGYAISVQDHYLVERFCLLKFFHVYIIH